MGGEWAAWGTVRERAGTSDFTKSLHMTCENSALWGVNIRAWVCAGVSGWFRGVLWHHWAVSSEESHVDISCERPL